MTGPAPGKIPLDIDVKLCSRNRCVNIECDVYLHLKGYSLARVTHLDLENSILNQIVPPRHAIYRPFKVYDNILRINLGKKYVLRELGIVANYIRLDGKVLSEIFNSGTHSWVYIGGKYGGIFLGFRKQQIIALEEYAAKLGYYPR